MKTILKVTIFTAFVLSIISANAQEVKKHEFRPFYGTAYAATETDMFAKTLTRGLFGTEKSETSTFGMLGLGYRYNLQKFAIGIDLGFSSAKEELFRKKTDKKPYEKSDIKRYFVMPTASYSYYKTKTIELYGSISAGAIFESTKIDKKNTDMKKADMKKAETPKASKTEKETLFAYQINPIGLRIGNETIGAFVELGYGQKGLVSAGLSFKF